MWLLLGLIISLTACAPFMGKDRQDDPERERLFALTLPLTGSHADIGARILRGARFAEQELVRQGYKTKLLVIDTGKPNWLKLLQTLPQNYIVVGGPLDQGAYKSIKSARMLHNRVFFAFLNNLDGHDEGSLAYRFFPSPQDQVAALVNFSTAKLNIKSFGAFYPEDKYSQRMVTLFASDVKRRHLPFYQASYNARMPNTWRQSAQSLVGSKATPEQQLCEAVFVPASFKHVDNILASFLAHGEDRLVMLGTMLWEQSLTSKHITRPQRYELVMFPGAFNNQVKLGDKLGKTDFWFALGYDFARFASNLGLVKKPLPAEIVWRANHAARVLRCLAPISWDSRGVATQQLFLYRVSGQGIVPVEPRFFNQLRATRRANAQSRFQKVSSGEYIPGEQASGSIGEVDEELAAPRRSKQILPEVQAEQGTVKNNGIQPRLGTVPQSSHKLSLPKSVTPMQP
ncbi:MAG: hypothetical protein IJU79_01025 [Desulfovibrionaceae bacterium]|nr:hypothetical protein [Desulfovibrionaceae bacterium]